MLTVIKGLLCSLLINESYSSVNWFPASRDVVRRFMDLSRTPKARTIDLQVMDFCRHVNFCMGSWSVPALGSDDGVSLQSVDDQSRDHRSESRRSACHEKRLHGIRQASMFCLLRAE